MTEDFDFDGWRRDYDSMDFEEQVRRGAIVDRLFPFQAYFDLATALDYFEENWGDVAEVGGHQGELASAVLARFDAGSLPSWTNYDISRACADEVVCEDARYKQVLLTDFLWSSKDPLPGAILLSTHTFEHFKLAQIDGILARFRDACGLYLEVPIADNRQSFMGDTSTHVIDGGWLELDALIRSHHYKQRGGKFPHIRWYAR